MKRGWIVVSGLVTGAALGGAALAITARDRQYHRDCEQVAYKYLELDADCKEMADTVNGIVEADACMCWTNDKQPKLYRVPDAK